MLTIRFNRTGKKNRASYRVVLQEKAKAPGKRHVEILGSHDPHTKTTILRKERILHWIGLGAQPSPVVHNLLLREGIIEGKKIPRKMPRPVKKEEPVVEESVVEAEAPVVEATPQAEAASESPTPEAVAKEAEAVPAETVEEKA